MFRCDSLNEVDKCPRRSDIIPARCVRRVRHVRGVTRIPLFRPRVNIVRITARLHVQVRRVRDVSRALKLFRLHPLIEIVLGGLAVVVVGVGGVCRKCLVHRLQVDQWVVVVAETSVIVPVVELFQIVPELVEVDPGSSVLRCV